MYYHILYSNTILHILKLFFRSPCPLFTIVLIFPRFIFLFRNLSHSTYPLISLLIIIWWLVSPSHSTFHYSFSICFTFSSRRMQMRICTTLFTNSPSNWTYSSLYILHLLTSLFFFFFFFFFIFFLLIPISSQNRCSHFNVNN